MNQTKFFKAMISNPIDPMFVYSFHYGRVFDAGAKITFPELTPQTFIIKSIEMIDHDEVERMGLRNTCWNDCLLDITVEPATGVFDDDPTSPEGYEDGSGHYIP